MQRSYSPPASTTTTPATPLAVAPLIPTSSRPTAPASAPRISVAQMPTATSPASQQTFSRNNPSSSNIDLQQPSSNNSKNQQAASRLQQHRTSIVRAATAAAERRLQQTATTEKHSVEVAPLRNQNRPRGEGLCLGSPARPVEGLNSANRDRSTRRARLAAGAPALARCAGSIPIAVTANSGVMG